MQKSWSGCTGDDGWFTVKDNRGASDPYCLWQHAGEWPSFMYSKLPTKVAWGKQSTTGKYKWEDSLPHIHVLVMTNMQVCEKVLLHCSIAARRTF